MSEKSGVPWGLLGAGVLGGLVLLGRVGADLLPIGARVGKTAASQADQLRHVDGVLGAGDEVAAAAAHGLPDELVSGRSLEEIRALGAPSEAGKLDEVVETAKEELFQVAVEAALQLDPGLPNLAGRWEGSDSAGAREVERKEVEPGLYQATVTQAGATRKVFEQYGTGQVCIWTALSPAACWRLVEATEDRVGARNGAEVWRDRRVGTEGPVAPGG